MECSFTFPVYREKWDATESFCVREADGHLITAGLPKANADYIVQVINSHEKLVGLLKMAQCPNCDGSGAIPRQISERRYVTKDMASDAGDMALEGSLYSDEEWEAEQCQWCDERDKALKEAEKA